MVGEILFYFFIHTLSCDISSSMGKLSVSLHRIDKSIRPELTLNSP